MNKQDLQHMRDTLTLRAWRKKFSILLNRGRYAQLAHDVDARFQNAVYIFQRSFFDRKGQECINGGAERYCLDLAEIIAEQGLCPVLVQMGHKSGLWQNTLGKLHVVGLPVRSVAEYNAVIEHLRNFVFVIYSVHFDMGRKLHPNILISHGIVWDNPERDADSKAILKNFVDADTFVSVDTNTISWLRSTFARSLYECSMHYIPNYVDRDIFKPAERAHDGTIRIVFPRRCSAERGYWLLSACLPDILRTYDTVRLDFVGYIHSDDVAADLAKHLADFPDRVRHYQCPPENMPAVYQRADITLIPTLYSEGTSLSCLEAQACGNAVIATNIGGLPNLIIDGFNGLLVSPNSQELFSAICKLIDNPALAENMKKEACRVSGAFDKRIWTERWRQIVSGVLKQYEGTLNE
ncbi:glycosyltransferase family 4 protein [Desulfovibrio sp. OttesenSCG-928-I05]|nr:glycosyltransferase family 4 protein [Desulfovibrio sp. OttesenSCG-928-I05]